MIGDDKIAKQNYSVARVVTHNKDDIGKFERHIEHKNDNYANMNVDLSQSHRNIQFKKCDCTYNDKLNEMVECKQISLRGLKADVKIYDEMIFDVITEYFESHGGYEFAKKFMSRLFTLPKKKWTVNIYYLPLCTQMKLISLQVINTVILFIIIICIL